MKKIMAILLAMLLVLPGVSVMADETDARNGNPELDTAFEADALILTEAQMPAVSAEDFEFPDELWEFIGGEKPEDPYAELGQALSMMETEWYSLSPGGDSGVLSLGDTIVVFYDGKYHILYPSFSQGVADEYGSLAQYAEMAMSRMSRLLGTDGVIYSADGRYAAICNVDQVLQYMNLFIDPILIDLSTGAMILTATYSDKIMQENAGAMTTACFSSDNQYFYYYLYGRVGETNSALCRYDLQSGDTQILYSGTENLYYPRLSETAEGALIILQDVDNPGGYMSMVKLTEEQGEWDAELYPFDLPMKYWRTEQLQYSTDSGYAVVAGGIMSLGDYIYGIQCINTDEEWEGWNRYLVISKEDDQIQALDAQKIIDTIDQLDMSDSSLSKQLPYHMILHGALSPDGQYLLLHTLENDASENAEKTLHLYMVRLKDLEMKEVKGIDPADISYETIMTQYKPGIEWNTGTLLIGTKDGVRTYRFQ